MSEDSDVLLGMIDARLMKSDPECRDCAGHQQLTSDVRLLLMCQRSSIAERSRNKWDAAKISSLISAGIVGIGMAIKHFITPANN